VISGHGYLSASIMLIADGCTDEDVSTGYAISGYQENVLKGFAIDNGIDWGQLYLTALIKERIKVVDPKSNIGLLTDEYKRILIDEIKTINPNILVPLSELSFNFVSNLSSIYKFRGSVLPAAPLVSTTAKVIPVLGIYPYINQDYKLNTITRLDFGKVAKNVHNQNPQMPENIWVARTGVALQNFIQRSIGTCSYLVFDIETFGGIPTCISLCFNGRESCTVPLLDAGISLSERVIMMHEVAALLASPIPKINQNIKFDWKKLERFGFYVRNIQGDTLLATSCLYCEFPKNLGFLTSIYTDMPYFKDEGKQFDPTLHNRDRLYLYCAKDSLATHQIYSKQQEELAETNTIGVYNKLIEILPLYKRMEERGILIDLAAREKLTGKYESLFDIQLYKLRSLTNQPKFNPLSSVQCQQLVYETLEYKPVRGVKHTKAGNAASDEESLELLIWVGCRSESANEILRTIINCRKLHKVLEILYDPLHLDNRLRCEFNLAGSENGRTTASHTTDNFLIFHKGKGIRSIDLGRSFQTLAKHGFEIDGEEYGRDIRSMFTPSPGYCFVECDLSQAEARVDAVLAADFDFLPIFDGPIGIHRLTGSWLFNKPPKEIKKGTREYLASKIGRHAGERNMREDRLMMMLHQSIKRCKEILEIFHSKQPNIRGVFHEEVRHRIQKDKVLIAPNGRRRDFFGRFDKDQINEGISFLPQAIVTDYLKSGLHRTFETCNFAIPLSEAHDGFLAEVEIGRHEEYAIAFKMNTVVDIDFRTCSLSRDYRLKIPMEVEWSKTNWQEMEPLKLK
jgi:DNA polymerase I-like protein with 3'-5' exonuclease and polymerase domains